ncbi:MAG: FkbM family methyltransferase [Thermodesulfobacteriota bacterium]|nr:FkbM family methyltransferase [Thermodesulfobacteriota bacterium]
MRKLIQYITGNRPAQNFLERHLQKMLNLMGVGSGVDVTTSGETIVIKKMAALLAPPYRIFDVGANRGQFLNLVMSALEPRQYEIHCFEPAHHAYQLLEQNLERSESDRNIVLNNFGLGKTAGEYELFYNEPGAEIASLTRRRVDHFNIDFSMSEMVNISTLDHYCREKGIDRIDLLKIDVEGHELDILDAGARQMFEKKAVRLVSFEFGGCNIDTRTFFQDFFYLFKSYDMKLHRITPSGYLSPVNAYKESFEQFSTTNFLAVQQSLLSGP